MTAAARGPLKIGLIGLGDGAPDFLQPFLDAPNGVVVAAADIVEKTREAFQALFPSVRVSDSAAAVWDDPEVEAVWVSSPVHLHSEHAVMAAEHGKHVVVKTPLAVTLDEADRMIEAAERNGVYLIAGHTQSFTAPIRAMRAIVASGEIGGFQALSMFSFSDWILRARTGHELDVARGGGIVTRHGVHQLDAIRFLGGGLVRSVRGTAGSWFKPRTIPGYFNAYLEFDGGQVASIMHNAYGYFVASELGFEGEDKYFYTAGERAERRRQLRAGTGDEIAAKDSVRNGAGAAQRVAATQRPGYNGYLVASCSAGDLRYSADGIYLHDDLGRHDLAVPGHRGGTDFVRRRAELDELHDAIGRGTVPCHDGRWGKANLELALAIMQSGADHREITLSHQVAVPAEFDRSLPRPEALKAR